MSVLLVAYNNLINRWGPFHGWAYVPANFAFGAAVTVVTASSLGLSRGELGLQGEVSDPLVPAILVGVFALGALAIARSRHAHRIADRRVAGLRGGSLGYYVLLRIPLGTAVAEEVLFRGVLFAAWRGGGASTLAAALYSSVAFGLWHIAPTVIGLHMNDPTASKEKVRTVVLGAVMLTIVAGLGLTWLRVDTDGLLAPVVLHAGTNSVGALAVVGSRLAAMRRLVLLALVMTVSIVPLRGALAHGDLRRSDPQRGDHVRRPPATIELDFAEPPTADSRFEVIDGCKQDVLASVGGEGPRTILTTERGAPGRWRVNYRTVSSVDGHLVEGSLSFHVGNKKPCLEPEPTETVDIGTGPPITDDDGGGFPVLPIALAGVGIVGVALLIRRMGA